MASENKVTLHGFWASPYVKRVELALKLKGIPYDYVEEDLMNKSPTFVALNPVHKKVPVLVHNGRAICESIVILEYIDEMWPSHGPKILPEEPYERAQARFWAIFLQQQVLENMLLVLKTEGEAQRKAMSDVKEKLQILEDHLDPSLTCINKPEMGFLDIVFCSFFGDPEARKVNEEVLGKQVVDLGDTPLVSSWCKAVIGLAPAGENRAPREKLVGFLKFMRQNALKSSPA